MILAPEDCGCPIIEEGPSLVNSPVCSGNFLFMVLLQSYLWGRCSISTPCKRIESVEETEQEYDFIVVGAGSAGSIVAGRLSENTTYKVVLLEAGGPEPLGVRVPSFYRTFWDNPAVDWQIRTVPADYCLDQEGLGCKWPLGKGLGGTSQLNGMMYHRGHHADYTCDWVEAGAKGWSWDEIKPFMDLTEGNKQIGSLVDGKYHSDIGPLPIQTRYTTARAYLPPQSERPNLNIKLHAHVTKVLFRRKKAIGVEYVDENGNTKVVKARKEVILSAGALTSPKILMHSGVGPKETLEPLGIKVIEDLPVGKNLKNHCGATLYFILKKVKIRRFWTGVL
ncbi:hypothetical protein HF086_003646 [Spodoptera exigua]|uniref:Glucose-methanol-choline oxidoreductase N-terminal domain-containing protein n=1 Tax=Spodoptera exigua TaxID=7107 RepID=A0A922MK55_SPOEX|nr:hypothetical protein HF086_003646 [Spodoptera exigua]